MGNSASNAPPPKPSPDDVLERNKAIQEMDAGFRKMKKTGVSQMRIIVRGERGVGKTALVHRLQGKPFQPTYVQTGEIQTASITWSYKPTDENVKVEVWDVVDKGFAKTDGSNKADALKRRPQRRFPEALSAVRYGLPGCVMLQRFAGPLHRLLACIIYIPPHAQIYAN